MINKNNIGEIHNFNLPMLKDALRQTELRVNYTIDTKKRLDTKAFALLSIFLSFATIFVALINSPFFVATYEITNSSKLLSAKLIVPFLLSSITFIIGAIYLLKALRSHNSATIGRYPETWLYDKNKIAGEYTPTQQADNEGYIITHILFDYQDRIAAGDSSNDIRVALIDKAITWGIMSPILLLISSLILMAANYLNLF